MMYCGRVARHGVSCRGRHPPCQMWQRHVTSRVACQVTTNTNTNSKFMCHPPQKTQIDQDLKNQKKNMTGHSTTRSLDDSLSTTRSRRLAHSTTRSLDDSLTRRHPLSTTCSPDHSLSRRLAHSTTPSLDDSLTRRLDLSTTHSTTRSLDDTLGCNDPTCRATTDNKMMQQRTKNIEQECDRKQNSSASIM